MSSWFEMKERRRVNRGVRGSEQRTAWREGRKARKGWAVVEERKTGEIVAQAHNGCFGRMAEINRDIYDLWARGTLGAK